MEVWDAFVSLSVEVVDALLSGTAMPPAWTTRTLTKFADPKSTELSLTPVPETFGRDAGNAGEAVDRGGDVVQG